MAELQNKLTVHMDEKLIKAPSIHVYFCTDSSPLMLAVHQNLRLYNIGVTGGIEVCVYI